MLKLVTEQKCPFLSQQNVVKPNGWASKLQSHLAPLCTRCITSTQHNFDDPIQPSLYQVLHTIDHCTNALLHIELQLMLLLPLAASSSSTYLGGPFWPTRVIIWKYHCHNRDLGRPCKTRTAHKNAHEFITLSSYFFGVPPANPGCKYEELRQGGDQQQGVLQLL